jgi:cysteine desulfurase
MRRIYLDCNATAPVRPEARAAFLSQLDEGPGNAGSVHLAGHRARMTIERAREAVAALVGAAPREVVFTATGTEANNLALYGLAQAVPPGARRIVASGFEHPSVDAVLSDLGARGFEIIRVPPRQDGVVPADRVLAAAPAGGTAFVSLMLANNEIGTIQPVDEVGVELRRRGVPLHSDAVQAAGKLDLRLALPHADLLSLAAHKLGGTQGAGALVVREGIAAEPLLRGGGQEMGRRPGTENVAAIAAFGAAATAAREGLPREMAAIMELRDRLERAVVAVDPGARINASGAPRLCNTTSLFLPGTAAESLVMALDLEGVAVSAGAACSSGTLRHSPSLLAMGLAAEAAASIRISLGPTTTSEDVDGFLAALGAVVDRVRANDAAPGVREAS